MATKRPSKAEIRRRIQEQNSEKPAPPLRADIAKKVNGYSPRHVDDEVYEQAKPFIVDALRRYEPTSYEGAADRLTALTAFAAWALERDYALDRSSLLTFKRIQAFIETADLTESAVTNYGSRLRGIARKVNGAGAKSTASVSTGHRAIKPPYTPSEIATMLRIARTQPSESVGRQIRACVGLGFGAGFDSVDIKPMYGRHVEDLGDDGIRATTPDVGKGSRPRTVWVRRKFEDFVREGIDGIGPDDLLTGESPTRRNVASKVYENAHILGDAPHFEQSRMRTTWLADLITSGVPLPVIMDAAGLTSARTLTDLVPMLDLDIDVTELLRGDA